MDTKNFFRSAVLTGAALGCISFGSATSALAITYDALADFSLASNPNGPWSYGEGTAGTSFTAFVNSGTSGVLEFWQSSTPVLGAPIVVKNPSANAVVIPTVLFPTNVLTIHPGPVNDVIVKFTAPTTGTYNYSGLFEILDFVAPTGVVGEIFHNGIQLYAQGLSGLAANAQTLQPGSIINFSGSVMLLAGDSLSFAVNNAGNFLFDSTGFQAVITTGTASPVPLPAALPMFVAGLAGLGAVARRRKKAA